LPSSRPSPGGGGRHDHAIGAKARNLILTGGQSHYIAESTPVLVRLLAEHGIESTATEDIEAGLAALDRDRPALLTVYALRWRMLSGEKYAPFRARWGFSLSVTGRAAIEAHLARGGGLLALHTAAICFDDWPAWRDIVGGAWRWGRSSHPPYGRVEVRLAEHVHPMLAGLADFTIEDEVYGDLDLAPGICPLMHARAGAAQPWQPVLWTRIVGGGRVAFDALGHEAGAFTHPQHRRIVARAALWALGRADDEVAAA